MFKPITSIAGSIKRLPYQEQAVLNAKKILERYGGVFISDVVGLGKTYISALLAQQLDGRTLVLAPPALLDEANPGSWVNVFREFNIPFDCKSIGQIDHGDEFKQIGDIAKPFWEQGLPSTPPEFVIFMGGVGAGKTTIRRQKYAKGYVHFDFGEIYIALKKVMGENHPKLTSAAALACDLILRESIDARKNIVIEVTGDKKDSITPVIDKMNEIGYAASVQFIDLDPVKAYERHLQAVKEDEEYLSAFHMQEVTLSSFFHYFGIQ